MKIYKSVKNTLIELQNSEKTIKATFKKLNKVADFENTLKISVKKKEKQKKALQIYYKAVKLKKIQ